MATATAERTDTKRKLPQHDPNNRRKYGEAQQIIEEYLAKNGEITQAGVVKLLDYGHVTSASTVLRKMLKRGTIKVRNMDGLNRYYPASRKFSDDPTPKVSTPKKTTQDKARVKKWVKYIQAHPGATVEDVIKDFKLEGSYISRTVGDVLRHESDMRRLKRVEGNNGVDLYFDNKYKDFNFHEKPLSKVAKMTEGQAIDKLTVVMDELYESLDNESIERVLKYVTSR